MEEKSLIPNAINLMESTRSIGYSLKAAIADIVDNSIAANATRICISTPTRQNQKFIVSDDGVGMNEEELLIAMSYGSKNIAEQRAINDLGRFGLGLKMASLSQCRRLTVLSKRNDSSIVGAVWDLDHIAKSKIPWSVQILSRDEILEKEEGKVLEEQTSGTVVIWEKLDIFMQECNAEFDGPIVLAKVLEAKKHLSLVFHRYISGEDGRIRQIQFYFNDALLEPSDPFLTSKSTRPSAEDSFMICGSQVRVQSFVLPHPNKLTLEEKEMLGDLQNEQGFYIYRNYRLVISGTWFRLNRKTEMSKLARIRVDIPVTAELDKIWMLDVKKASASLPEALKGPFRKIIDNLHIRSNKVWTTRGKKEVEGPQTPIWTRTALKEGKAEYSINLEHPSIKSIVEAVPQSKFLFKLLSASLPLNSLYRDLSDDIYVQTGKDDIKKISREINTNPNDDWALNFLIKSIEEMES